MADNHFKVNRGIQLAPQASAPSNPTDGDIYYDSTLLKFRKYEGGQWSNFSAGGSGSGTGDDLNSLAYRVSTYETFDNPAAQLTNINQAAGFSKAAGLNAINQYWTLAYDASKTISTTGTSATLSATPAFTVTPGCVVVAGQVQRRITAVASQTSYTLEAAFPANLSAVACNVSEALHTVDMNNYAGDGLAPSAAITTTIGSIMVDYEDTTTTNDIILDNGVTPNVAFAASVDGSLWSTNAARPVNLSDSISSVGFATPGSNLYLRFFANKSTGSGSVNLLAYKAFWHQEQVMQNGNLLQQAYAFTDGSATAINSTISVVSGKTRLSKTWSYINGVNAGSPNGQLDVFLNGQKIPRFINTTITPDSYYKEIDGQTIELDSDYSTYNYSIESVKRIGVVDTSSTNASRISALEALPKGSFNYISNPDAESGLTGYNRFADAAAVSPTNGAGTFTSGITLLQNTSSPLRGTYSFQIAKDAANRQGQGVSYDFTIDSADKSKVLQLSMDYSASSNFVFAGSTSIGDIQMWIYDKTNGQLIQPAPYTLDGNGTLTTRFQTNSNSTSYRVIFYIGSTNALAWTFNFENVKVTYQNVSIGAAITDWTSFTPTGTWTTNAVYTGRWRRVGDSMQVHVGITFTGAPTGAGQLHVALPSGYQIDLTKRALTVGDTTSGVNGTGMTFNGSSNVTHIVTQYGTTTTVAVGYESTATGQLGAVAQTTPFAYTTGSSLDFEYQVPIVGWSSNVQMSSDTDTRVVAAILSGAPQTSYTANTAIIFPTIVKDTHGAYNNSTGQYATKVPGYYNLAAFMNTNSGTATLNAYVNNVKQTPTIGSINPTTGFAVVSGVVFLNAGDLLDLRSTGTWTAINADASFCITRLSGASSIASTESIYARYSTSASTSVTGNVDTTIPFNTKISDTHGAFNTSTGVYTVPVSGEYDVAAMLTFASQALSANTAGAGMTLYKNGSPYAAISINRVQAAQTLSLSANGSVLINCVQGDLLEVKGTISTTNTLNGTASQNHFQIKRIGN